MSDKINSGRFLDRVTWKAPTAAKDSFGQTKRTFADYRTDYVQADSIKGDELPVAARMQYVEGYVFTGWYDSAINNKYQVEYEGEQYNIVRIEPVEMKMFMRVTAVKIED